MYHLSHVETSCNPETGGTSSLIAPVETSKIFRLEETTPEDQSRVEGLSQLSKSWDLNHLLFGRESSLLSCFYCAGVWSC